MLPGLPQALRAIRKPESFHGLLFLPTFSRYNHSAVNPRFHSRFFFLLFLAVFSFWAASCAVPLGPGYSIEKQQIRVQFVPKPEPHIRIEADYLLKNTGNRPLSELELRLPANRFHSNELRAAWDGSGLTLGSSAENPQNALILFAEPWTMLARHTLHLSAEFLPAGKGETGLSVSNDAFFLPAEGWSFELLPPGGLFATGGVPPKRWDLIVAMPEGFLVHTSGGQQKTLRKGGELTVRAEQQAKDRYPFVIAGRYSAAQIGGKENIHLWTRKPQEAAGLRQFSEALVRTIEAYDSAFGERPKGFSQTWIVECPALTGCFTKLHPAMGALPGEDANEPTSAEMISEDTMMVDLSAGTTRLAAAAAPALATSWLGYAPSPGSYEQALPIAIFSAFAASIGRNAVKGADSRAETIRRALRRIPANKEPHPPEDQAVLRTKSFLFFHALQDRYGREAFRKGTSHMLYARRGNGFELSDLIAAFEQETHQNVAEFVRLWMKHPGVPEEFRARYAGTAAAATQSEKENRP